MKWLIPGMLCFALASSPLDSIVDQIAASGRVVTIGETADQRVTPQPLIAPGQAPLFSFRLYEGQSRQRFANADLMLDDAGH